MAKKTTARRLLMTTAPEPDLEDSLDTDDDEETEDTEEDGTDVGSNGAEPSDGTQPDSPSEAEPTNKGPLTTVVRTPISDGAERVPYEQKNYPGMPKDGIVLETGMPLLVRGRKVGNSIILTESVYIATRPYRSRRWVFQVKANKGEKIDTDRCRLVEDRT